MNYDEQLAQRIVETAVPGFELHFNVDQSTSVADFSMTKGGIDIGLLEVTRFTDPKREQLWKEIQKDWLIDRKHCKSDWRIHLGEGARVKQVRARADEYLREIEKAGIDEFSSSTDARHEGVRRIWEDLNIEYGKAVKWKRPGIGMGGPSSGGFARPETVWHSVKADVWKDDNRNKLSRCSFSHRHLFVVIEGYQGPAYVSIRKCEPPKSVPSLPSQITHLWVAAEEGSIVYVWLADSSGWRNMTDKANP